MKNTDIRRWLIPAVVPLLTALAFVPSLQNEFVNWDDRPNFVENPHYRGLGWSQLVWMFTTFHMGHYQPLSWVTLGLDYLMWGMNPGGYHFTNLLLHSVNAVLFYFVSFRLLDMVFSKAEEPVELPIRLAAGMAALFFSLHPLRVESVAWATERRDVLSGLFYLWAVLCYLRAVDGRGGSGARWRWMGLSYVVYFLSLLSKASGMTLPLVLLVLDVYPLKRLGGARGWIGAAVASVWREKALFVVLALGAAGVAAIAQYHSGAMISLAKIGLDDRLAQTLYGMVFYLWKTLVPLELSPLYERPIALSLLDFSSIRSFAIVVIITVLLYLGRRRWPGGLTCWIYYLVVLAPVTGMLQSGPQLAADRYSYLSCLGWAVLLGAGLLYLWRLWTDCKISVFTLGFANGAAAVALILLALLTWKQSQIWHDSERLWRHALAVMPSALSHYYLATVLGEKGEEEDAIKHFRATLEINSGSGDAHYNLGKLLFRRGEVVAANRHYQRVLEINPNDAGAYTGLGLIAARKGELDDAVKYLHRATELNPRDAGALNNLAIVLARQGRMDEAIQHFRHALEFNRNDVGTHSNLAKALLQKGDVDGAVEHLRRALEINPKDAEIHSDLALILSRKGELASANRHFRRALEINPDDPGVHSNLAINLVRLGNLEDAIKGFKEALRAAPEFAEAHAGLARVLALQGKGDEAVHHYQEALRLLKSQSKTAAAR